MRRALNAEIIVILRSRMMNIGIVIVVAVLLLVIYRGLGGSGCLWKESMNVYKRWGSRYYRVLPLCIIPKESLLIVYIMISDLVGLSD